MMSNNFAMTAKRMEHDTRQSYLANGRVDAIPNNAESNISAYTVLNISKLKN